MAVNVLISRPDRSPPLVRPSVPTEYKTGGGATHPVCQLICSTYFRPYLMYSHHITNIKLFYYHHVLQRFDYNIKTIQVVSLPGC